ncbi:MAG: bifunctional 4-hydroxy-2-oxoglutarate aldolase/2-dehydro-3-deoxy-phosphogluconate aldolase [Mucinivorans sp.]
MNRIQVALQMKEQGIIPVFYNADIEICKEILTICHRAGIRAFEFTNRGDFAHLVFAELSQWAHRQMPDMMLGVGSVVDAPTAAIYIQLGAAFVVSPLLNPEVGKVCNRRKVLWAPGCGTLSEINQAEELGAEIVKIFPGSSTGGPEFVKSILGPCPWSWIMPTGGVEATKENLGAWFKAGVVCVGMGSNLFPRAMVEAHSWDQIAQTIDQTFAILKSIR